MEHYTLAKTISLYASNLVKLADLLRSLSNCKTGVLQNQWQSAVRLFVATVVIASILHNSKTTAGNTAAGERQSKNFCYFFFIYLYKRKKTKEEDRRTLVEASSFL